MGLPPRALPLRVRLRRACAEQGAFRPLKVVLPEGTMISAIDNAAMSFWNLALKTVIDTIYLALSQAMPDQMPAAHHAQQGMYTFYGRDADGARYSTLDTTLGGWGAQADRDGFSPLKTTTHGDTRNIPVEVEETFIRYWSTATNSVRIPPAQRISRRARPRQGIPHVQDSMFVTAFERTKCPPWGLFGGKPAQVGGALVTQPGAEAKLYRKVTALPLKAGTTIELLSAGGGGRNAPEKRPFSRVADDVRNGYVTIEGARRDYAVVIDAATLNADETATKRLREELEKNPIQQRTKHAHRRDRRLSERVQFPGCSREAEGARRQSVPCAGDE